MISIETKGDFENEKLKRYFGKIQNGSVFTDLDRWGQMGVHALEQATPIDSGITAGSWTYKVTKRKNWTSIWWYNHNTVDGVPVVILLQYGHGTRGGGYVQGKDFINPATQRVFDEISSELWKKVKAL